MKKYCINYVEVSNVILVISFRYAQVVDEESLVELAQLIEIFRREGVKVIFTGLHLKLMNKMEKIQYFSKMLQEE